MNMKDINLEVLKDFYHEERDIFCIFEKNKISENLRSHLCEKASQIVSSGFLFQTSGSTGQQKFVLHSTEGLLTSAKSVLKHIQYHNKDQFLCPLSIYHMGGFSVLFRSLVAGSPWPVIMPWDGQKFLRAISETLNPVHVSMVSQQIYELVQAQARAPQNMKSIIVGGGALDEAIYLQALDLGWPVLRSFGSTEAASQIFTQKFLKEDPWSKMDHWKVGLDGEGHLKICGDALFKAYLFASEDRKEGQDLNLLESIRVEVPKKNDGYWITEDRVELKDSKFVRFLGRDHDFVKINSSLINVRQVQEEFLIFIQNFLENKKISLSDFFITVLPDRKAEHQIVLVSRGFNHAWKDILIRWNMSCKRSAYCIRGYYVFSEWPKNSMGKIQFSKILNS